MKQFMMERHCISFLSQMGWLKTTETCLTVLEAISQMLRCQQDPVTSEILRGILPCLFLASGVACNVRFSLACRHITAILSLHGVLLVSLSSLGYFLTRTESHWVRSPPYSGTMTSLYLIISAMTLIPKKVIFCVIGP